jgi:hypothetical protein
MERASSFFAVSLKAQVIREHDGILCREPGPRFLRDLQASHDETGAN